MGGDDWMAGFDKEFISEKPVYDEKETTKGSDKYHEIFKDF